MIYLLLPPTQGRIVLLRNLPNLRLELQYEKTFLLLYLITGTEGHAEKKMLKSVYCTICFPPVKIKCKEVHTNITV